MIHVVFLYSIVSYLYLSLSGLITSVWEERANISASVYLLLCGLCSGVFSSSVLGIGCVKLLWHSMGLPYKYFDALSNFRKTFYR